MGSPLPIPTISGTPATTVVAGTTYRFAPTSTDAASFSITNLPPWAAFDTATGTLSGTPSNASAGRYDGIVINVVNAAGSASLASFSITVTAVPTAWQPTQGPEGGDIDALVMDPSDHQTLYVAMGQGGVFKSSDGGATWGMVSAGLSGQDVAYLAVDTTSRAIFAGTRSAGVFKSSDGGMTWNPANSGLTSSVIQTLLMDDRTHSLYAGTYNGLFRSIDGGASWNPIGSGLTTPSIWGLALDPSNAQTMYAGTYDGIFKSIDAGVTWSVLGGSPAEVTTVMVDPKESNLLYAVTDNPSPGSPFVFRSADGGSSWNAVTGLFGTSVVHSMAIDPSDSKKVYLLTVNGIFKSADSGASWAILAAGPQWTRASAMTFDMTNPGTLYVGTYQFGMFKSADGGVTWSNTNIGLVGQVQAIAVDPFTSSILYAGTGAGLFRSTNRGGNWTVLPGLSSLIPISAVAIDPQDNQTIYVGTQSGPSFYKSVDGGASWTSTTLPSGTVSAIVLDPADSQKVYIGTFGGVYRSVDGGVTWSAANSGVPSAPVSSLSLGPDGTLYRVSGGVFKSTDGASSWVSVNDGISAIYSGVVVVDPGNGRDVYAAGFGAVFRSTTGGSSWSEFGQDLFANRAITSLAVTGAHGNTVYVGTFDGGAYRSTDGGVSWSDISSGLFSAPLVFAIDPMQRSTIYAGTSNGVYQLTAPVISGTPASTALVDTAYGFTPTAPAATGFTIANKPSWALFDSVTGALTGTPAFADVGSYPNIVITVTNPAGSAQLPAFSITVVPPMPRISGTPGPTAIVGSGYLFSPTATYAASYSIVNKPSWAAFDPATGSLAGTPSGSDVGTYTGIVISATNSTGTTSLPPFSIAVKIDGICGTAHGSTLTAAPTTNLCAAGSVSVVFGSGPWTWSCSGSNGGGTASCSASIRSYSVTIAAGAGGKITSGSTTQVVNHGGSTEAVTAGASTGYHFVNWSGPNGFASTANPLVLTGVTGDQRIMANFQPDLGSAFTVTVADALRILQITTGVTARTPADDRLDIAPLVNGLPAPDGNVDLSDAVVLMRYIVGLVQW